MPHRSIVVTVDTDDVKQLLHLVGRSSHYPAETVTQLLQLLVRHAADGVRRPGSWERAWIVQATGVEIEGTADAVRLGRGAELGGSRGGGVRSRSWGREGAPPKQDTSP